MAFQAVITQAGLDKAISASSSGVQLEITHIAAGTAGYTAERTRTALSAEVDRVPVAGGRNVSGNQIHLTAEFQNGEYACRELGFFLKDGTLFAVMSHPSNVIFYKTQTNTVIQAFDLVLDAVPTGSITVNTSGDLSLYYAETFANINTAIAHLQSVVLTHQFDEAEYRSDIQATLNQLHMQVTNLKKVLYWENQQRLTTEFLAHSYQTQLAAQLLTLQMT